MGKDLVSVIIPTYKGAKALSRAIDSVLNQTYKNLEIIIVDDNVSSSDERIETEAVVSKYKEYRNIHYIKHEKNMNGAAARNTGISYANGEYICFLDDDDLYLPTRIEKSVKKLDASSDYDAVFTGVAITIGEKIKELRFVGKEEDFLFALFNNVGLFGTGSNLFLRKEAVTSINGFDTTFIRHQDVEFMLRFFMDHQATCIDEVLVVKSTNGTNNQPEFFKYLKVKEKLFSDLSYILDRLSNEKKAKIYYTHCNEIFILAHGVLNVRQMISLISKIKKYRPISFKEKIRALLYSIQFNGKHIYKGVCSKKINEVDFISYDIEKNRELIQLIESLI